MAKILFITGGSRSGKSNFALKLAEELDGPRAFIATCPITDPEMADRIARHKAERDESNWVTIEEQINIPEQITNHQDCKVFLVDCLTLWVNNLIYQAEQNRTIFTENDIIAKTKNLLAAIQDLDVAVLFVSSEVGSGIVPENSLSRLYRDLIGRCNQILASAANDVFLVVSGIPVKLK